MQDEIIMVLGMTAMLTITCFSIALLIITTLGVIY